MSLTRHKLRVGIMGCGAIGSRIAQSLCRELKRECQLAGLYDIDQDKAADLEQHLSLSAKVCSSFEELLDKSDILVEAINAKNTRQLIRRVLRAGKSVLVMSVGQLLRAQDLFRLARANRCHVLLPSGAIAGIDAIKAAALAGIETMSLTTRKPVAGFKDHPYLLKQGIDVSRLKKQTVIFEGSVQDAVRIFPRNINVAATLALASHAGEKMVVRIVTSPRYKINSHEIEITGPFGRIVTRTENRMCPDNPKTSYLAVLSGIQTLKQYCEGICIGT